MRDAPPVLRRGSPLFSWKLCCVPARARSLMLARAGQGEYFSLMVDSPSPALIVGRGGKGTNKAR
jgi:hypothetical protein